MPGGSSTNNGSQVVTIYSGQQISSIFGNSILRNIVQPGAYDCNIIVSDGSSKLSYQVMAGSTFVFRRPAVASSSLGIGVTTVDTYIKVTLQANTSVFDVPYTTIGLNNVGYIYADFDYTDTPGENKYVQFYFTTVSNDIKSRENSSTHVVSVATLLNLQSVVSSNTIANTLHISYDFETNKNLFTREYTYNNQFNIDFDPSGRGVYVGPGSMMNADGVINWNPTFNTSYSGNYTSYPKRESGATTGLIIPPPGLVNYTVSPLTNKTILVTGSETNYLQVDFLRVKLDEITHNTVVYWDSYLIINNGSMVFTTGSWNANKASAFSYISNFNYPIVGNGITLMVSVRPRGSPGTSTWYPNTLPTTDGATNIMWPENCWIMKDINPLQIAPSKKYARFKLPISTSTNWGV